MRAITFRFWSHFTKMMSPKVNLRSIAHGGSLMEDQLKYLIPLQFTGLKDKNGKEIYEGDIIKGVSKETGEDVIREVKWQDGGAAFYTHEVYGSWPAVMIGEVIGNIYENPELVKR